jgi:hypothetical protein
MPSMILRPMYPSDTLRSPLAARANLNVAIPSSRAARGLERLPSPTSVSHTRQNSSAPVSFCIRDLNTNPPAFGRLASATPVTEFDLASDTQRTPIAAASRPWPNHPCG